ncbi:MAG TPA: phenol hydroxylase subunit [Zoogloea sp.]|jgi:phenol hydroxylase P0 protein|nr:phenol hydroxylase [Zoogloea sp.]HQX06309.1 phenol hydroxylase subunit [Zoogloea sp.]
MINPTSPPPVDVSRKYVRLVERRPDGLVEFEFSISDPALFVEMLLPEAAYEEFCLTNRVILLEGERPEEGEDDFNWSLREATHQRFR